MDCKTIAMSYKKFTLKLLKPMPKLDERAKVVPIGKGHGRKRVTET
jgi:hypothetical protein